MTKTTRNIFIVAALVCLTSCAGSFDGTDRSDRPIEFVTGVADFPKAADVTTSSLEAFAVRAVKHSTSAIYFDNVVFARLVEGTFTSGTSYYWPHGEALDFYAYAPVRKTEPEGQIVHLEDNGFKVTPDTTGNSNTQADLVFACEMNVAQPESGSAVPLVFHHAESKIQLHAMNSSNSVKFEVEAWKISGIKGSGTFRFRGVDSDGFITADGWDTTGADEEEYYQIPGKRGIKIDVSSPAKNLLHSLILIPQTGNAAISVKMKGILVSDSSVVFGTTAGESDWFECPVAVEWTPGRSYTYVVDLAKALAGSPATTSLKATVAGWDERNENL